jgi:hypothetical protein
MMRDRILKLFLESQLSEKYSSDNKQDFINETLNHLNKIIREKEYDMFFDKPQYYDKSNINVDLGLSTICG